MFSWLLGKKKSAAAAEAVATVLETTPEIRAAAAASTPKAEIKAAPEVVEPVPKPAPEAAAVKAEPAPEPVAKATPAEVEVVPEPVAVAAPVEAEPAPVAEIAPAEAETPPKQVVEAAPVRAEPAPMPMAEAPPAEVEPVTKPVTGSVQEPEFPAVAPVRRLAGRTIPGKMDALPQPAAGMFVALRSGRSRMQATVDEVSANGRRIFVALPGSSLRRPYTRRQDGSYRLEGAPDNSQPVIEIREPGSSGKIGRSEIQRCKPLRYVKRRRSLSVSFLQGGRRAARARAKAADFGHGSKTGRRPVTKAPIRTPKRSKPRSRMPSSSR